MFVEIIAKQQSCVVFWETQCIGLHSKQSSLVLFEMIYDMAGVINWHIIHDWPLGQF